MYRRREDESEKRNNCIEVDTHVVGGLTENLSTTRRCWGTYRSATRIDEDDGRDRAYSDERLALFRDEMTRKSAGPGVETACVQNMARATGAKERVSI